MGAGRTSGSLAVGRGNGGGTLYVYDFGSHQFVDDGIEGASAKFLAKHFIDNWKGLVSWGLGRQGESNKATHTHTLPTLRSAWSCLIYYCGRGAV